jgi:hypothetical protein
MTAEDQARVTQMVEACAALFNRSTSPGMVLLYIEALSDYTADEIGRAFRRHMTGPRGTYFPLPAHLVEQLRGDAQGAASIALGTLRRAIQTAGSYRSVIFEADPVIGLAVESMGGWVAVCRMEEPGLSIEFGRVYATLHNRGERAEPVILPGLHGARNRRLGMADEPVRIGASARDRLLAMGQPAGPPAIEADMEDFGPEPGE